MPDIEIKLFDIPAGTPRARCRTCNALIFFAGKQPLRATPTCYYRKRAETIETPGCRPPTDTEPGRGFSHFIDCPGADLHRQRHGGR